MNVWVESVNPKSENLLLCFAVEILVEVFIMHPNNHTTQTNIHSCYLEMAVNLAVMLLDGEASRVPRVNPCMQRENLQTPHRKTQHRRMSSINSTLKVHFHTEPVKTWSRPVQC